MIVFLNVSKSIMAIPIEKITHIVQYKNEILVAYETGLSFSEVDLYASRRQDVEVKKVHYDTAEIALERMRDFYTECRKGSKAFFF